MMKLVELEQRGAIDIVTLNRPEALNALSDALVDELTAYLDGLRHDRATRVVILKGAGRAFCAGLDIKEFLAEGEETRMQKGWRVQIRCADLVRAMRAVPQPFIGLGHGSACGAGFSLLLACDVRYGAPDLRMNAAYLKIGLGGADMGSSWFLPRMVGASVAAELLLSGRFLHADRALRLGLLSDVVPADELLATGLALAEEMAGNAPHGLALTKQSLNANANGSLEAAMALEDRQQVMLQATEDHLEAMRAFVEKRVPVYQGR